jgi:hypothetical protein
MPLLSVLRAAAPRNPLISLDAILHRHRSVPNDFNHLASAVWSDGFCRTVRRNLGGCALTARGVMRTVRITSKGTEDISTDSPFADVL